MKIYTKTGDLGETGLWGGKRVSKNHPRVCAYGDVDELNCMLGVAVAALEQDTRFTLVRMALTRIQEECFVVGTLLAAPTDKIKTLDAPFDIGLPPQAIARLEAEIDHFSSELPTLTNFIMPGGTPAGALLHLARTICRRAERSAVALAAQDPIPNNVIIYLNRLSDHLFTTARWINATLQAPETPWQGLTTS